MEAYRDQYAKLFNNGRDVAVIGISVDPDTMLAAWARELGTPVLFASDSAQTVGKAYGSVRGKLDSLRLSLRKARLTAGPATPGGTT